MKKLLLLTSALMLQGLSAVSFAEMTATSPVLASSTTPEIITAQPTGELLTYDRNGYAWYDAGSTNRKGYQTGTIDIVFADDNKVYLKQPLSKLETDAWIVGILDANGTTLTVDLDQCLGFNEDRTDYVITKVMEFDEDYEEFSVYNRIHQVTYTIAADRSKITLNGTSSNYILGAVWASNNEWTGYGDYASVYTPAVTNTLVTPPSSMETEKYQMTAQSYINQTEISYPVSIGFDGNDMYVKGAFVDRQDQWIKGTKQGDKYVFSSGQYLGKQYGKDYFMVCTSLNDTKIIQDFVLTWDEATECYANATQFLIESGLRTSVYMTEALSQISIKKIPNGGLSYPVPYDDNFASAASMTNYTIIDDNYDKLTWDYNNSSSRAEYNSMAAQNGSDDWLISPAIELTANVKYTYTVYARSFTASMPEKIEVKAGNAATAEAMDKTVIAPVDVATGDFTPFTGSFTPSTSGKYYFGLHAITPTDQMSLYVNHIVIDEDKSGIEDTIIDNTPSETTIYTIDGIRIDKITRPGIYIINGKKQAVTR